MKIAISGATGKMGKTLIEYITLQKKHQIVAALTRNPNFLNENFIVTDDLEVFANSGAEIIIDYSRPQLSLEIAEMAAKCKIPLVCGTTGFTDEQFNQLITHSAHTPILQSGNTSIGINLVQMLAKALAAKLDQSYDIEIIEKHHKNKVDAPSGTALMLAKTITDEKNIIYGRKNTRKDNEVGIASIRAGNIIGEHEIIFASEEEIIKISHQALSRNIFVKGAIQAAEWLVGQRAGFYNMNDMLR